MTKHSYQKNLQSKEQPRHNNRGYVLGAHGFNYSFCSQKTMAGSIIIFTVLMITVILTIALTLTRIFIPKLKTITESSDSIIAIYAADSALERCLYVNRQRPATPPPLTLNNGATWVVYKGFTTNIADCYESGGLNHRAVGSFRNVIRSFQLEEI